MKLVTTTGQLPNCPAVYAMYGGHGSNFHVAYVGIAGHLKRRIEQHLIRRDSGVITGTSVVSLNPDFVTKLYWWEHQDFEEDSRLRAAEEIAFKALNPMLRSRGKITDEAKRLCLSNEFKAEMERLFKGDPSGEMQILTLNHAFERLQALEQRIAKLERPHE